MDKYEIGFSDEFTYNGIAIKYDISKDDNMLHLYVEDCAKALGVTQPRTLKDGSISYTVRWNRVYGDLVAIGILDKVIYKYNTKEEKRLTRNFMKDLTITKNEAILWCYISQTKESANFIQILSNLPYNDFNIHEYKRREVNFLDKLEEALIPFNIKGIRQYNILNYYIDYYIPSLNIAIEYDEEHHKQREEEDKIRQKEIKEELGCKFVRVTDDCSDEYNVGLIIKEITKYDVIKDIINAYIDVFNKEDSGIFLDNYVELILENDGFSFSKSIDYIKEEEIDYIENYESKVFDIVQIIKDLIENPNIKVEKF